jgi:putative ABC transport system permease protein
VNAFAIALDSIWRHRLRSALTALGVVIGVFAVVTLTSLGAGVQSYVTGAFSNIGATIITVSPSNPQPTHAHKTRRRIFGGGGGGAITIGSTPSTLTVADTDAILAAHAHSITRAAPVADLPVLVSSAPAGQVTAAVEGTTGAYFAIERLAYGHGRWNGTGAVLGQKAAQDLFPGVADPVGRTITVGKRTFTVAAVLRSASGIQALEANHVVFVPVAAGLKLAGLTTVSEIVVEARSTGAVNQAANVVTTVMNRRHPSHNFTVVKNSQLVSTITSTLSTITTFLAGLAAISLLVGGIGIMNIMLVTVTERFREIGIRKAMGARDGDILTQFLAESVLLALLGGGIGIGLSAIASSIVAHLAKLPSGLTVGSVVLALIFSIAVGVVFGVLPALRAARLMPVEALRTE